MDYKEKWNEICYHMSKRRNVSERDFQTTVEFLFEKLGWSQYKDEIVSQKAISVGSASNVKPDIVIKNNGQVILVIELKKPNVVLSERNAKQLKSYMRLLKLNFGILLGETIQLYYELPNDNKLPIKVTDIPFINDLNEGVELIKFLSKEGYSFDNLQKYCADGITNAEKNEKSDKFVDFLCSKEGTKFVADLVREKLLIDFSDEIVLSMIDKFDITIKRKEKHNLKQTQGNAFLQTDSSNSQNIRNQGKEEKVKAIRLCKENGLNLNEIINFASQNNTTNKYWINPNINRLSQSWWLLLRDSNKNKLHVFNIPANSISKDHIKFRSDFDDKIDLQIIYDDKSFEDSRSGIKFVKWFIKTISY